MRVTLTIDAGRYGAAAPGEVAHILRDTAARIEKGNGFPFVLFDSDGNRAGAMKVEQDRQEGAA